MMFSNKPKELLDRLMEAGHITDLEKLHDEIGELYQLAGAVVFEYKTEIERLKNDTE